MTVAITPERLDRTMQLLQLHVSKGWHCPTNREIALWIGMGTQKFQPHDRMRGLRSKKPEAGSVMVQALEFMGNRRTITIVSGEL